MASDGRLERRYLPDLVPGIQLSRVVLFRAFDRWPGTSITVFEAACLSALANYLGGQALEIGTWDGNTALVLAAAVGRVVTVDLPIDSLLECHRANYARQIKGHRLADKIALWTGDSRLIDWNILGGPFDLIFIDGGHDAPSVQSDTQNALVHLKERGAIVWHDYGAIDDVTKMVDALDVPGLRLAAIKHEDDSAKCRLAVGLRGIDGAGD